MYCDQLVLVLAPALVLDECLALVLALLSTSSSFSFRIWHQLEHRAVEGKVFPNAAKKIT